MRQHVALCFAALALLIANQAAAWSAINTCCDDPVKFPSDATMKLLPGSFPAGSVQYNDFKAAADAWNRVSGTWFDWTVQNDNDSSFCFECDGSEAAIFSYATDRGLLGYTWVDVDDALCNFPFCDEDIDGADIAMFLADKDGTPYPWVYGDPTTSYFHRNPLQSEDYLNTGDPGTAPAEPTYFRVTLVHELGHAIGLGHASNGAARMESHYPSGGWFHQAESGYRAVPLADDCEGMRSLYPASGSGADIYLTSWQDINFSTDKNGGIDSHPTSAYGTTTGDLLAYPANRVDRGRDRLQVRRGDDIDLRVCIGNKGVDDADAASLSGLELFLSTDLKIGTSDLVSPTVQSWVSGAFEHGKVYCRAYTFRIPSTAVSGKWYYVGTWINRGSTTGSPYTNNITMNNRRLYVE